MAGPRRHDCWRPIHARVRKYARRKGVQVSIRKQEPYRDRWAYVVCYQGQYHLAPGTREEHGMQAVRLIAERDQRSNTGWIGEHNRTRGKRDLIFPLEGV